MMKKNRKEPILTCNILTLIMFSAFFMFIDIFPRHIFNIQQKIDLTSIINVLVNLLFHFIFFVFLTVCFCKNKTVFSDAAFYNVNYKKILILFIIQISIDFVIMCTSNVFTSYSIIFCSILSTLFWLAAYYVLQKNESSSLFHSKKTAIVFLTIIVAVLLVLVASDFHAINSYRDLYAKYQQDSDILKTCAANKQFENQLRILAADIIISVSACILHYKNAKSVKTDLKSSFTKTVSRTILVLTFFTFCVLVMVLIFPHNLLINVKMNLTENISYVKEFRCLDDRIILSRKEGNAVYDKTFYTIRYGNKTIKKSSEYIAKDKEYQRFLLGDEKIELLADNYICYADNEVPKIFDIKKIGTYDENEKLIHICKELMLSGDMNNFEYCCEYLSKYDRSFIKPYLLRYRSGSFNKNEEAVISKYQISKEYIISKSQTLFSNIFL